MRGMKIIETLKKWNGTNLTKVVYPIIIFLTGWYIVANVYRLLSGEVDPIYTVIWALIPIAFAYLAIKGVKLKFRWSVLSVIGIILIAVFALSVCLEIASPYFDLADFFLTGQWDHFLFPIAFGLFFLCDLRRLPRRFWVMLAPFALFCVILANLIQIANVFFDKAVIEGAPGFFGFFGVTSWAEFNIISQQVFIRGLAFYMRELLTFFTLFPIVIFYYLTKSVKILVVGSIVMACIAVAGVSACFLRVGKERSPATFFEDFESETQNWDLEEGWHLEIINNNTVLRGEGHKWARLKDMSWSNYAFRAKFKIIQGTIHFNYRLSESHRYFIGVNSDNFHLQKQIGDSFYSLTGAPLSLDNGWHGIEIRGYENTLSIYIDNAICAQYEDENFIPSGGIAFETLDNSEFLIDNVEICVVEKENVL